MLKGYRPRWVRSEARVGDAASVSPLPGSFVLGRPWQRATVLGAVALVSLLLLGYGAWLLQLERAARVVAHGDLDAAIARYESAEWPFRLGLARLFPDQYGRVAFGKVGLMFNRGKTADAVAELERIGTRAPALTERAEFAFWNANVLLRRALEATDSDVIIKHLYAASAQYRKALEASPQDWDIKYNYELVQHVLAEQEQEREKEQSKMKSILERIRTITEPAPKEPPPPEKQG